ncbi:MAG TPA: Asp-tRNA(Asn)/Glu-tRNA(Gln) amidotransferase GatCAB subunit B, partial [Pseudomonadota bacterium]|nr:Asp-tRNA(Asn)/Glu-tRNA(Gln) amidotransferase GatCAB subunit B [Pseudomonadota bacterium]
NINSFKYVQHAIEHEILRQIDVVQSGGKVVMETRGWDAARGTSRSQRKKEQAHDYRYMPDPDLPPLHIDPLWLDSIRAALPATPMQRRDRYIDRLGLSPYDASVLTAERELCDFFDAALVASGVSTDSESVSEAQCSRAKLCANWLSSELLGLLNKESRDITASPVSAESLGELVRYISDDIISGKQGKEVFSRMYESRETPTDIIERLGLRQITDEAVITAACRKVVADPALAKQIEKYKQNPKLLGFFVGKALAETQGKAKPDLLSTIMQRVLSEK